MATTIRNLPYELLVESLGKLIKKDLKSARLVCTLWSAAGAQWMFQRVYFAPRKTSMKVFTDIAANPAFAQNVKELIYDARLFLPILSNYGPHYAAFAVRVEQELDLSKDAIRNPSVISESDFVRHVYQNSMWNGENIGTDKVLKTVVRGDSKAFRAKEAESLFRYSCLLQQQESVFTKAEDLKALSEGLNSFRNITRVGVSVDFRDCLEYIPYAGDRHDQYIKHHQWYSSRSYTEFGFVLPPSKWDLDQLDEELVLWQWENIWEQWEGSRWDVRGVHNLFRAMSTHRLRIKELRIGSRHYRAPITIFQLSDIEIDQTAAMARDLTTLRLHPYVRKGDDSSEYAEQHHCLRRLLQEAKGLRNLSISHCALHYEGSDKSADDEEGLVGSARTAFHLSLGKQWPHLTKLKLKDARVEARDLMMIFRAHAESLRELSLVHMALLGKERWEHLGTEKGQILELHSVCVSQLYEKSGTPDYRWPREEQGFVLIRKLMQWAHPDELEIEENHRTFSVYDHGPFQSPSKFTGRLKASLRQMDE